MVRPLRARRSVAAHGGRRGGARSAGHMDFSNFEDRGPTTEGAPRPTGAADHSVDRGPLLAKNAAAPDGGGARVNVTTRCSSSWLDGG